MTRPPPPNAFDFAVLCVLATGGYIGWYFMHHRWIGWLVGVLLTLPGIWILFSSLTGRYRR